MDIAAFQRGQGVERLANQRTDADRRHPFIHQRVELRLIAYGEIGLACRQQQRHRGGVRWRDRLNLQPLTRKGAALFGGKDGRMIGIDEPVEEQAYLLRRLRGRRGRNQQRRQHQHHFFHDYSLCRVEKAAAQQRDPAR